MEIILLFFILITTVLLILVFYSRIPEGGKLLISLGLVIACFFTCFQVAVLVELG